MKAQTVGTVELAKLLGVTRAAVHLWRQNGCPSRTVNGAAAFVVGEVVDWRLEQARTAARGTDKADLLEEQARRTRAEADISELKAAHLRGELLPAGEVRREMERRDGVTRAALLGMRGKYAADVYAAGSMAEAADVLDRIARDVVSSLQSGADELETADEEVAA
jgi:phage terminase Nu1 subunit (DNA packaging protein)